MVDLITFPPPIPPPSAPTEYTIVTRRSRAQCAEMEALRQSVMIDDCGGNSRRHPDLQVADLWIVDEICIRPFGISSTHERLLPPSGQPPALRYSTFAGLR